MTATASTAPSVLTLRPEQVAQHPGNLRDATRDIDALAASIAEVGVLVPLIVVPVDTVGGDWADTVTHVAVDGNRRQLAAAQLGVDLPCIVRDDLTAARDTALTMTVTALARDGWTLAEEIHGVQTLLDLGLSQAAISRASGRKTTEVRAAKKAATLTPDTLESARAYDLTLDQLAVLADHQGDDDAVCRLLAAAEHGRMAHVVAQLDRERHTAAKVAAATAALTAQGITVTDERPGMYETPYRIDALLTADGQPITADDHRDCPGHAVHVTGNYAEEVFEIACCTADPATTTHQPRYPNNTAGGGGAAGGPTTDEQKAQRRDLIHRNKEMLAAQDVRRAFLRTVLAGKKHSKTAPAWALAQLVTRDRTLLYRWADHGAATILAELLGQPHSPDQALTDAPAARHPLLLWATVCAVYESVMPKDVWRTQLSARVGVTAYLAHLEQLGYTPCDTEHLMIHGPTAATDPIVDPDQDEADDRADDDIDPAE